MKSQAARKVSTAILSMVFLASTAMAGSASASPPAEENVQLQAGMISKSSYIQYLKKTSDTNPEAKSNLTKFQSFSDTKQGRVIERFNDPEFQKALVGGAEAKAANGITEVTTMDRIPAQATAGMVSPLAVYDVHANFTHSMYSYGLHMITLRQDFYYQTGSNRVLNTKRCTTGFSKSYPFGNVTRSTRHFVFGTQGRCRTTWTLNISYGIGNITGSSIQQLTVNGPGVVSRIFYDI